jgi:hypothetical protein
MCIFWPVVVAFGLVGSAIGIGIFYPVFIVLMLMKIAVILYRRRQLLKE